jgi:hypothetical protein
MSSFHSSRIHSFPHIVCRIIIIVILVVSLSLQDPLDSLVKVILVVFVSRCPQSNIFVRLFQSLYFSSRKLRFHSFSRDRKMS